jgi:hypothetical protein
MGRKNVPQGAGLRQRRPQQESPEQERAESQRQGYRRGVPRLRGRFQYHDEDGQLLYQVCRYAPDRVMIRRPDGSGQWTHTIEGVRWALYRLPELLRANVDEPVFIVDRERDADRLARLGLVATTQAFGPGQWDEAYNVHLTDRTIVILSTTHPATAPHDRRVAASVITVADGVKWITLPGLEEALGSRWA